MDFRALEAAPGVSVVVLTNSPKFTRVAVSNDFLRATGLNKEEALGVGHFEQFPKNPADPNFTGEDNLKSSFDYVTSQKQRHEMPVQRYDIPNHDGTFSERYWKATNVPLFDESGEVRYIIHSAIDVTTQILAEQRLVATQGIEKAYNIFMNAPVIITIVKGENYVIEMANDEMLKIWGKNEDVIGKPVVDAIPELKEQGFVQLLDQVRETGKSYHAYESPTILRRNGKEEVFYFDFVYQPYYDDPSSPKASGVIGVAHDVTEQVLARKQVAEVSESLNFRNALFEAMNEATPDGIVIVDAAGKILLHNQRFIDIWNMPEEIIDSRDDFAALEHAMTLLVDPLGFIERVKDLYRNKKQRSYEQLVFKDGRVVERIGAPIVAENGLYYGWAWEFREITDRIKQEQKFRNVVEQAADPILILKGPELVLEVANKALFDLWHVGPEAINKPFLEILPEMQDQGFVELLKNVLETGEPFYGNEVAAVFQRPNGVEETRFFNFSYQPYRETNGQITGVLVLANDVTGQVQAKKSLIESEKNFRSMILQSPVAMCILKGDNFVVEIANARMLEIWGKGNEMLQEPLFEALPEVGNQGFESLLSHVLHSGETFYANEQPVRVPRKGKLETVYANFVYEPFRDGAGSITGVMAVAIDVTEQFLARKKIEQSEQELLSRVHERTAELKNTNDNLQQFAYAASHDLKAPIRKIHMYVDGLKSSLEDRLTTEEAIQFHRIENVTDRMSTLIDDLLSYSEVSLKPDNFELVDMNEVVALVLSDLDVDIEEKKAKVFVDPLNTLKGHHRQLQQVFHNLIGNALKYVRPDVTPEIHITSDKVLATDVAFSLQAKGPSNEYYVIQVKDNGIGFDQKDADKIFKVFTRLHNDSKFRGTGVGLAIVSKVIENHNGFVEAEGTPGKGAIFRIYLPANGG